MNITIAYTDGEEWEARLIKRFVKALCPEAEVHAGPTSGAPTEEREKSRG